jgi:HAD superfamily hydrolase (TIGR01509 family)
MTKLIIFDMDGLLLDSERPFREAWLTEAEKLGYLTDHALYSQVIGRTERDSRKIFCRHFGQDFPYDKIYSSVRSSLEQGVARHGHQPKAGAVELLQYLANRSVPCVVATSTAHELAQARLQKAKILDYFQEVTGGDEVLNGKPHPDLFLLAARKQKVASSDCLVLEDSEYGARAAQAAGMPVIVIPDLKEPPEDVRRFSFGIYASLTDARPAIENWLDTLETTPTNPK